MADNPATVASPLSSLPVGTVISTEEVSNLNGSSVPAQQVQRVVPSFRTADATAVDSPGDAANGQDVDVTRSVLPTGASTEATVAAILAKLTNDPATQTTLAAILAKIIAAPATAANQSTEITALALLDTDLAAIFARLSSDPATQTTLAAVLAKLNASIAITAASLPLPAGAATAAKQPALGTAGTPSADVVSVQGVASMTPLKVDGSATTQPVSDGGGSLTVDGTVAVSGITPGTTATSLGKAEDQASADGDVGVMALAIRKDVPATTVSTDGDYTPLETDANGRLHVIAPLPVGASTETTLAAVLAKLTSDPATQTTLAAILAKLVAAPALDATVAALVQTTDFDSRVGSLTETAPTTDIASSGLNGRLQRIAQRITSFIALIPSALGGHGGFVVEGVASGTPVPVSGSLSTTAPTAGTVTQTTVAASASTGSLLANNSSRKGASIFNDGAGTLYIRLDPSAATTANFTVALGAYGYYEVPFGYTNEIRGIWSIASGNARISEWT